MIKVLYVNGTGERAGAERILFHLVTHLDRKRFEPVVAFLNEGPFIDEIASLDIETKLISKGTPRVREPWRWADMVDRIKAVIQEFDPDIIQATGEKVAIFAGRAAKPLGVPSIGWLHDAPGAGGASGWLTQIALKRTPMARFVTCASWMADEFNRRLNLGAVPIVNSVEVPLTGSGDAMAKLKADHGWASDAPLVGHFARLQRWKGSETFVRAAARVLAERPETRFVLVGDAMIGREVEFAGELKALARQLGLGTKLVFTGYRSDALDLMARTDIVVHCSLTADPLPTVILEAMALGRAVVATRTRGPEEEIVDGESGVITSPGDDKELAMVLGSLLADHERREALGARAAERASALFLGDRMSREFCDLYEELARTRVPR